ncbi:MAG: aldo/keto reductase [Nitrospirota bacterium]
MKRVLLGATNIEVSVLGIGMGTSHPSGRFAQSLMSSRSLADILIFAFEKGINFWDTAFQYQTYPHIKEALKRIDRADIVITTKFTHASEASTIKDFYNSLREVDTDYFDICLLHGVRSRAEFIRREGAFNALLKMKQQGKIRAIGISSHGLGALQHVLEVPEIDVVWARINYAGIYMDTRILNFYDRVAAFPYLKNIAHLLPNKMKKVLSPKPESQRLSEEEKNKVEHILARLHSQSKGIVGMKILVEGYLSGNLQQSIEYASDLPFIDAFIIGMLTQNEIDTNCSILSRRR